MNLAYQVYSNIQVQIFQALSEVDDLNLLWYTIFVIGYRLRSLRFVRGGETNEPYT